MFHNMIILNLKKQLTALSKVLIVFSVLTISLNAQSDVALPKTYTLQDCINLAKDNNPDYRVIKQRISLSKSALKSANGTYYPALDFSASFNRQLLNNGAKTMNIMGQVIELPGSEPNSFYTGIGVNYSLFDGFNRSNNYKVAELNVQSSDLNLKAFENQLVNNVNRAFVEVIKKQEEIKIQNENLALGKAQLEEIKAKFAAGAIHIGLVSSQESELANREFAIVQAENDINNSKLNLLNLLGLPLNTEITLSDDGLKLSTTSAEMKAILDEYSNIEKLYEKALANRYDLQVYTNAIEASKLSIEAANSGYYPKLSASAGWNWSNSKLEQFKELSRAYVGASLSIPIFDQFRTNYQVENAKFELYQNEAELFKLKQSINNAIHIAQKNLMLAYKQLEIGDRALVAAENNYNIAKERFSTGASGISDYIIANNAFVVAKINRNSAFYNFYLAQKEIEYQISNINSER